MNISKSKILIIAVLMIGMISCSTAKKVEKDLSKQSEINNYFRGFVVYNTKTHKEIVNYNGGKYFTPASNTKLFTFYTAYRTFKDSVVGFQYVKRSDSLIIKGTADPSLLYGFEGNRALEFLKRSERNIYLVDEDIAEPPFGEGWSWDDYTYYYMPEKNLFPIYGNVIELTKGEDIKVVPEFFKDSIEVNNEKRSRRAYATNQFYVKPTDKFEERQIPFVTSNRLVADLLGEEVDKNILLVKNKDNYYFKPFYSVSYDSLYHKMLHVSDNFIAEQLMLQVGNEVDRVYSVKKAISYSLDNYLKNIPQKPRWVDGSGLSRYNLFTPESFVYLLKKMYREIPKEKLFDYFPAGGKRGTLEKYFANNKPYIFAKTGTLSNNFNLSGFLVTKKGTVLIFSYMNNHYKGSASDRKKEMEIFFKKLYNSY